MRPVRDQTSADSRECKLQDYFAAKRAAAMRPNTPHASNVAQDFCQAL